MTKAIQTNQETVAGAYEAIARGDVNGFLSVLDEKIVLREPECLPYGGTAIGLKEALAVMRRAAPHIDSSRIQVEELLGEGDRVVAVLSVPLRGREDVGRVVELWRLRQGRVIELEVFWSDPSLLGAE